MRNISFLLLGASLLVTSCRTDPDWESGEARQQATFKVFQQLKNKQPAGEPLSYAGAFAYLASRYDSIHGQSRLSSGQKFGSPSDKLLTTAKIPESGIYYGLHSQTFHDEDGDSWVAFPYVENGTVTQIYIAWLGEAETKVSFYSISSETEFYQEALPLFRAALVKSIGDSPRKDILKTSSEVEAPPRAIGVVYIPKITKPIKPTNSLAVVTLTPPAGCTKYADCLYHNDIGGGGGESENDEETDNNPCAQSKDLLQNPSIKNEVDALKSKSKVGGERGFTVDKSGNMSSVVEGEEHRVNLGQNPNNMGAYHNHTPTGYNMFSVGDIMYHFGTAMNFIGGDPSQAFFGMVGSDVRSKCQGGYTYHHYIMRYTGSAAELINFTYNTNWDKANLNKEYRRIAVELSKNSLYYDPVLMSLNEKGLEKLFFETLKMMGLENKFSLQRVEGDAVQNITLENGEPKPVSCP